MSIKLPPASRIAEATPLAEIEVHFPSEFNTKKSPVCAPVTITSASSERLLTPLPPTLLLISLSPKYKLPVDELGDSYTKYRVLSSF
jgi:hypothetical protein